MIKSNDQQYLSPDITLADKVRDSQKALKDLWEGVSLSSTIRNFVTVNSSPRFKDDHPYPQLARSMRKAVAQNGFNVMTNMEKLVVTFNKNNHMNQIINTRS